MSFIIILLSIWIIYIMFLEEIDNNHIIVSFKEHEIAGLV